jgi:hypothetical protein
VLNWFLFVWRASKAADQQGHLVPVQTPIPNESCRERETATNVQEAENGRPAFRREGAREWSVRRIGPRGGKTGKEITSTKGKPLPPVGKGETLKLVDKTKHRKSR